VRITRQLAQKRPREESSARGPVPRNLFVFVLLCFFSLLNAVVAPIAVPVYPAVIIIVPPVAVPVDPRIAGIPSAVIVAVAIPIDDVPVLITVNTVTVLPVTTQNLPVNDDIPSKRIASCALESDVAIGVNAAANVETITIAVGPFLVPLAVVAIIRSASIGIPPRPVAAVVAAIAIAIVDPPISVTIVDAISLVDPAVTVTIVDTVAIVDTPVAVAIVDTIAIIDPSVSVPIVRTIVVPRVAAVNHPRIPGPVPLCSSAVGGARLSAWRNAVDPDAAQSGGWILAGWNSVNVTTSALGIERCSGRGRRDESKYN